MATRDVSLRTRPGERGRAVLGAAAARPAGADAGVRARDLAAADGEMVLVRKEFPMAIYDGFIIRDHAEARTPG
jgi:hypothetical protein